MDKTTAGREYPFLCSLISFLAYLYINLAGITTRVTRENADVTAPLDKSGTNYIYAMWHCGQVFLAYAHRNRRICALVSRSKDGEYMARIIVRLGLSAVRGSTSKGGPQALLELMDSASAGFHPALTPDGPRGPRRKVQQGIIYLAQKTALPIVPVACGLSRKLVFRSWDEFQVPLPFGRAAVVYGEPVHVSKNDSMEEKALELEKSLNLITSRAEELALSA